jgi:NitT/TauT family transport system permease protein
MTYPPVGVEVEGSTPVATRAWWRRLRPGDWAVRVGTIAVLLGIWQWFGPSMNKLILRPPSDIVTAFFELVDNGELQAAMGQSLKELIGGFVIALVLGILIGVASGRWRFVYNATDPIIAALYSVPSVALVPLIAVAFRSIGDAPRITTVALFAIFPILINTQQGVRNVDRQLLEVARSFNTSERRMWTDVIVPSAIPYLLAGVRLAIGRALIGMIIAEFFVGLVGLGYLIISYENVFRIDRMFVPVIVVATMGVLLMGSVQWIEGRVAPWLKTDR